MRSHSRLGTPQLLLDVVVDLVSFAPGKGAEQQLRMTKPKSPYLVCVSRFIEYPRGYAIDSRFPLHYCPGTMYSQNNAKKQCAVVSGQASGDEMDRNATASN